VFEVDAFDLFQEAVHEMLARLFAVAHDVQTRVFLGFDPQQRRVGLGLEQRIAFSPPLRPELVSFSEPGGLGQATGYGGFKHQRIPFFTEVGRGERVALRIGMECHATSGCSKWYHPIWRHGLTGRCQ
jgi:hypothetical protein